MGVPMFEGVILLVLFGCLMFDWCVRQLNKELRKLGSDCGPRFFD